MAHSNSPLGQWAAIMPVGGDPPAVFSDIAAAITAIEKQVTLVYANSAARDSAIVSPTDGMTVYLTSVGETYRRISGAWVKIHPIQYSGAGAPAAALGAVGDVYFQTS